MGHNNISPIQTIRHPFEDAIEGVICNGYIKIFQLITYEHRVWCIHSTRFFATKELAQGLNVI